MKELIVDAALDQMAAVTEFADAALEEWDCPLKAQMQIDIAIDEIFSNIARYAYGDGEGKALVRLELLEDPTRIRQTFEDEGEPFDPLDRKDPDVTASADDRKIGGLGIFMVKKSMENITYRREGGKNILSFEKTI